jgi:hypothetical protein
MYGISKFCFKLISEKYCLDQDINFSWLRPVFTYGPYDVETRLIPKVIKSFLRNEDVVLNSCSAVVDYLYVEDFCKAVKSIIDLKLFGDYIISSNKQYQVKNVVEQIYQTIVGVLETDEGSFNSTVAIFGDQLAALKVMERSLNDTKSKLNEMQQNNINKLRLIEINDYYGAQYEAQRNLMFYVTWLACHIVGLCVVKMFIPPLAAIMFPGPLFFPGCIIGSLFVGLTFYIIPLAMDIRFRDNMNFQEYAWGEFNSEVDLSNPNGTNPWVTPSTCNC